MDSHLPEKLLTEAKWPEEPLGPYMIKQIFRQLAIRDSNNFKNSCGVGEREGRIHCEIVKERNFYLAHGIGRSGQIDEIQPKAIGSSIMSRLSNRIVFQALNLFFENDGCTSYIGERRGCSVSVSDSIIMPVDIDMCTWLCVRTLKPERVVLIDYPGDIDKHSKDVEDTHLMLILNSTKQTCLKTINIRESNWSSEASKEIVQNSIVVCTKRSLNTVCINSDGESWLQTVLTLCEVNSAHCILESVDQRCLIKGDYLVVMCSAGVCCCSPITGGSIVFSTGDSSSTWLAKLKKAYPGRATAQFHIDCLVSLLEMGRIKYRQMLSDRQKYVSSMYDRLSLVLKRGGDHNIVETISLCEMCPAVHLKFKRLVPNINKVLTTSNLSKHCYFIMEDKAQLKLKLPLCVKASDVNEIINTLIAMFDNVEDIQVLIK
ncbi:hypothetical protein GJ496_008123 [Pomphorhynchus laevis]|nr:hypothetical protein GJ496_008123 [Pomphorhynchus laevis]